MSHRTAVFITIDTEASVAGCFDLPEQNTPLLHEPVDCVVNGKSEGLGFILDVLASRNLPATFFVESLQSRFFGIEAMQAKAQSIVAAGHDLQLHVHPCWRNFERGKIVSCKPADHSTGRSHNELVDIFSEAIDHFLSWDLGSPTAVRTGNFSVGVDTFKALESAGIYKSSCISLAGAAKLDKPLQTGGSIRWIGGVLEVPLSAYWSFSPSGTKVLRPVTIAGCSSTELSGVLERSYKAGLQAVCINMHPFDFVTRASYRFDNLRPNRTKQARFESLCAYLASSKDKFKVRTFSSLHASDVTETSPLPSVGSSYFNMLKRSAENFYSEKLR